MASITEWAKSRRFFVTALIGLVFVLLRDRLGVPVDDEAAKAITESLVLWIIGESASATGGWKQLVQSPRFWALIAAMANAILKDKLGLQVSSESIQQILTLVQTLLAGYAMRPHVTSFQDSVGQQ